MRCASPSAPSVYPHTPVLERALRADRSSVPLNEGVVSTGGTGDPPDGQPTGCCGGCGCCPAGDSSAACCSASGCGASSACRRSCAASPCGGWASASGAASSGEGCSRRVVLRADRRRQARAARRQSASPVHRQSHVEQAAPPFWTRRKRLDRAGPASQGWQGRGGSPTRAPRPATPGEISGPRPAIPSDPSDPGSPARPGHLSNALGPDS